MTTSLQKQGQGFWSKPENYTKILGLLVLGLLGFTFLDNVLPLVLRVLEFATQTLIQGIIVTALVGLIFFLITATDLHRAVWLLYGILMKKLTNFIVTSDPIAVKEMYCKNLSNQLGSTKTAMGHFRGRSKELKNKLVEIEETLNKAKSTSLALSKKIQNGSTENLTPELTLNANRIKRGEGTKAMYLKMYEQGLVQLEMMEKFIKYAEVKLVDLKESIESDKERRSQIEASYKLTTLGKGFVKMVEDRELFDMAVRAENEQVYEMYGTVEEFIRDSKGFLVEIDINNETAVEEALSKMGEWENRTQKYLQDPNLKYSETNAIQANVSSAMSKGNYSSLFDKL